MTPPSRTTLGRDLAKTVLHSHVESIGLLFDALVGIASALAATYILVRIFRRIYKEGWSSWEAFHVSVTALFVGDLIKGIGHAMALKWVIEEKSYTGTFCNVSGPIRQLGGTYAALAATTISIQTFLTIWWLKKLSRISSVIIMGVAFIFLILFIAITAGIHTDPGKKYYSAPSPYWCWIGKDFLELRITGQYFWLWLEIGVSIVVYIPLFLLYRGVINQGTSWYSPKADPPLVKPPVGGSRRDENMWYTLLYPILNCVLILPLSIVRFIGFSKEIRTGNGLDNPAATLTVVSIFGLSGVCNALLYLFTRKRLFEHDRREMPRPPSPAIRRASTSTMGESQ